MLLMALGAGELFEDISCKKRYDFVVFHLLVLSDPTLPVWLVGLILFVAKVHLSTLSYG